MPMNMPKHRRTLASALIAVLALAGTACSDDEGDETTADASDGGSEESTAGGEDDEAEGDVVEVTATEYQYDGVPETVAAGTRFSLVNDGEEPHEFVAILLPEDEDRSVEDLLALPEAELDAIFGSGEPATVILAAIGQTDTPGPVVGDGTLTEPGRYAVVCFLPVGSTDAVLESEGPPPADGGPPHALSGMFAELTVE